MKGTLMPASQSILQTSIRSLSNPVNPPPPNAMTYTSTSLPRTSPVMRAFVMLKMRSTPKEIPTQGTRPLALLANIPTSSSYLPPAAIEPMPIESSSERSASGSSDLGAFRDLADLPAGGAEASVTTS